MEHPLSSTAAFSEASDRGQVEQDNERIATPLDGELMGSGPWADSRMAERSSFLFDSSTEETPPYDYQTRLTRLLNDDDDIGQERELNHEWLDHGREQLELDQNSKSQVLGYFDDSSRNSPSSWARGDYQDNPTTPPQNPLPQSPSILANPADTWKRTGHELDSPVRSTYRRPSYLHPSISRLRAHDRKVSTSSAGSNANPFGLSPSKLGQDRAPSTASRRSVVSRRSSTMGPLVSNDLLEEAHDLDKESGRASSAYGAESVASGLPIQAEEYRNRSAFAFQTLRTATDILWPPSGDGRRMPPIPRSGIFGRSDGPVKKKRFSIASAVSGRGVEESVTSQLQDKDRGRPVVLDVKGVIAVGTDTGWVIVFDFKQEAQCICGMESIAQECGPVTALTVSPDGTFVAVGHVNGNVYLYDLNNPGRPARSALALSSEALVSGRKEGHLVGTRIVDIDFVGKRHTAIVTSDEAGRAFWWSLGRVMGVESNDVVRLLGGLADGSTDKILTMGSGASTPDIDAFGPKGRLTRLKGRGSTLFAGRVLPAGKVEHKSDTYLLTAFLTPSKMVVVGLKPTPRIWFKRSRGLEGGDKAKSVGCVAWLPADVRTRYQEEEDADGATDGEAAVTMDPILAFSWGNSLRLVRVRSSTNADQEARTVAFDPILQLREDQPILAVNWLNSEHLLIATSVHLSLLNVQDGRRVEHSQYSMLSRLSWDTNSRQYSELASRLRTHKGKIFMLAETDLRAGSLLLWADRILALCHAGDFLSAIQLTVAYYSGTAAGNTIGLPSDPLGRRKILKARALSLMGSSLAYAFSQDRLTDGTYDSPDGRGVDLTPLFEGLADTCLQSCLIIDEAAFAYEDVYEAYQRAGIQNIFLTKLEKILLETRLNGIPPNLVQALIKMHDDAGAYKKAEDLIWHVDPTSLDINQAITLCEKNHLWDAYTYVYNQCMLDYITPLLKFISLMRPASVELEPVSVEHLPQAYTLFHYLETVLMGCEYPDGRKLPDTQAHQARETVYGCLLSARDPLSLQSRSTVGLEVGTFPVLRTILHYDTEALLHVLDIGFEDAYLNEPQTFTSPSRQAIVDALIEVMRPADYPIGDISFMHIFVARNLPKYPQFIRLSPKINREILFSLARDPDMTTREDRQLAAEHLLSVYMPPQIEERRAEFQHAQFHRILRLDYAKTGEWNHVIQCIINDLNLEKEEVFEALRESLTTSASKTAWAALRDNLQQMLAISVPLTARLLDDHASAAHTEALAILRPTPIKHFAYLGALLQPEMLDADDTGIRVRPQMSPSTNLSQSSVQDYLRLLCQMAPQQLLMFLQNHQVSIDLTMAIETCDQQLAKAAVIWAMDAIGNAAGAIEKLNEYLVAESAPPYTIEDYEERDSLALDMGSRLEKIRELVKAGILVCLRAEKADEDRTSTENLWFDLLAQMIRTAQHVLQYAGEGTESQEASDEAQGNGASVLVATLRQSIQDTLAALISSSASSTLSFPRLFRRLVQAAGTGDDVDSTSVYSEFRLILVSMLNTYHSEEDMLVLVTKLVQGDVFKCMTEMVDSRKTGWRAHSLACHICRGHFENAKEGDLAVAAGADLICIPRLGLPYHWACNKRSETIKGFA